MSDSNATDNTSPAPTIDYQILEQRVIELTIKLGTLFVLLAWCFSIIQPFILIVAWGMIVAIALFPVHVKVAAAIGGHVKTSATLFTLFFIGILVVPAVLLTESLITGAQALAGSGEIKIPAPPPGVADWPLIGPKVYDLWTEANANLLGLASEFTEEIEAFGAWLLSTVTGTGLGILQFIGSFLIAGILLTKADTGKKAATAIASRLAGSRGPEFAELSTGTIRNVALGIVGVSIFQTTLLSAGFIAIELPAAGLAALIALVLCIIQIGPGLVSLVAIIWAFSNLDATPATIFTIWTVVMTLIDSVLKPLVFGRGAAVPTLVIFLGAIGGMLSAGIIGLFVGAIILSLGYKLYEAWLIETPIETPAAE